MFKNNVIYPTYQLMGVVKVWFCFSKPSLKATEEKYGHLGWC